MKRRACLRTLVFGAMLLVGCATLQAADVVRLLKAAENYKASLKK